jgi:glycosyltransferase involved in cell wall biosynthesis
MEPADPSRSSPARDPHVAMLECDIAIGIPGIAAHDDRGLPWTGAELLVRAFTELLGIVSFTLDGADVAPHDVATRIVDELGEHVADRFRGCGATWTGVLSPDGFAARQIPPFLARRRAAWTNGPTVTAAVCTRNRPDWVAALLDSLVGQRYPVRVVVVDNARVDDRTERVVARFASQLDVTYALEPRPGLSWARNRSIEQSDTDVIAWVDDDECCDPWWAAEVARAFVEHPDADAVCGSVLPAEIDTLAQQRFEEYGGHIKGRGFTRTVFSPATRRQQSPLYPLPPFGVGGNMAFRREALHRLGGFDCALGAGTVTRGAEDTAALSEILWLGGTVVYEPNAMVRHRHRRDDEALRDLFEGYGCGLGAFYTSMVVRHPRCVGELIRLVPRALHDLRSRDGARLGDLGDDFPQELLAINRRAMRRGPWRYAQARREARRLRQLEARPA